MNAVTIFEMVMLIIQQCIERWSEKVTQRRMARGGLGIRLLLSLALAKKGVRGEEQDVIVDDLMARLRASTKKERKQLIGEAKTFSATN